MRREHFHDADSHILGLAGECGKDERTRVLSLLLANFFYLLCIVGLWHMGVLRGVNVNRVARSLSIVTARMGGLPDV